jgi:hypothetical protein
VLSENLSEALGERVEVRPVRRRSRKRWLRRASTYLTIGVLGTMGAVDTKPATIPHDLGLGIGGMGLFAASSEVIDRRFEEPQAGQHD